MNPSAVPSIPYTAESLPPGLLPTVLDDLPIPISLSDVRGGLLFVNRPFARLFGVDAGAVAGKTGDDVLPAALADVVRAGNAAVMTTGQPCEREAPAPNRDGQNDPRGSYRVRTSPLRDDNGQIHALCSVWTDLTQQNAHKRAQDALRRYQDVFELMEQGLVVASTSGPTLDMANSAYARMHGYTMEELKDRPIADVFPPEYQEEVLEMIRLADERGHHICESIHRRKDGSTFPVRIAMTSVKDASGHLAYRIGVVEDITARKQDEQTLRDRARLLDLTQDAILVRDLDGRILYWNAAAEAMYGWTADQAHGRIVHHLLKTGFPETASPKVVDAELLAHGAWEGELVHTRRDDTPVIVSSRQALRRDDRSGAPVAVLEVNRDITARKRAEEAERETVRERYWLMREAQSRAAELSGVMESIPDALFVGNEALITLANRPTLDLLGCKTVMDINRNLSAVAERLRTRDARTGEEVPLERWPFYRAIQTAQLQVQDLVVHHVGLGREVHLRCTAAPIRVNDVVIGAVSVSTNLERSWQRSLLRNLIEAQEEERRGVAYELHDGLTQYVMAAQAHLESAAYLYSREEDAPHERAQQEFRVGLGYLDQAVMESRRLVNGLRALALDDLGLMGALEQLLGEEKRRAGWTDAELVHNITGQRYPKVLETTIYRVAQEGLTNMRRHAQASRIRLLLLAQTDPATGVLQISLELRDWGRGFVPEEKLREYGHFGLQSMSERVYLVGGTYRLRSAPGEGTTISAVFPVGPEERDIDESLP